MDFLFSEGNVIRSWVTILKIYFPKSTSMKLVRVVLRTCETLVLLTSFFTN